NTAMANTASAASTAMTRAARRGENASSASGAATGWSRSSRSCSTEPAPEDEEHEHGTAQHPDDGADRHLEGVADGAAEDVAGEQEERAAQRGDRQDPTHVVADEEGRDVGCDQAEEGD